MGISAEGKGSLLQLAVSRGSPQGCQPTCSDLQTSGSPPPPSPEWVGWGHRRPRHVPRTPPAGQAACAATRWGLEGLPDSYLAGPAGQSPWENARVLPGRLDDLTGDLWSWQTSEEKQAAFRAGRCLSFCYEAGNKRINRILSLFFSSPFY